MDAEKPSAIRMTRETRRGLVDPFKSCMQLQPRATCQPLFIRGVSHTPYQAIRIHAWQHAQTRACHETSSQAIGPSEGSQAQNAVRPSLPCRRNRASILMTPFGCSQGWMARPRLCHAQFGQMPACWLANSDLVSYALSVGFSLRLQLVPVRRPFLLV